MYLYSNYVHSLNTAHKGTEQNIIASALINGIIECKQWATHSPSEPFKQDLNLYSP